MINDLPDGSMNNPFDFKTLKLDAAYRPIEIISGTDALIMCLIGKARPIESYDTVIRSPSQAFKIPSVIVLCRVVKFRFNALHCSRKSVFKRDNHTCQYCQKTFGEKELTLDHVLPKSRGGEKVWTNLVAACKKCNQKKGNKTPAEAGMKLFKVPKKPKNNIVDSISHKQKIWKDYLW
tara:strand:- start:551 stop:1084 length:534 start_codon:yes stop_codon:yes gene_type:complete